MKPKLTPWFPADVEPVRKGVYEVDFGNRLSWFAYWDGQGFGYRSTTIKSAHDCRHYKTYLSGKTAWRGLAQEPK